MERKRDARTTCTAVVVSWSTTHNCSTLQLHRKELTDDGGDRQPKTKLQKQQH